MSFEDELRAWLAAIQPDLKKIFSVLQKRLTDEPNVLMKDLTEAEAWTARCSYVLAQANSFLDKGAQYYMPPKGPDTTELARKTEMDAALASIREVRDKIEGLSKSLHTRISLGQSLLKWFTVNYRIGETKNDGGL